MRLTSVAVRRPLRARFCPLCAACVPHPSLEGLAGITRKEAHAGTDRPSRYSITKKSVSPSRLMSWSTQMWGWFSLEAARASCSKLPDLPIPCDRVLLPRLATCWGRTCGLSTRRRMRDRARRTAQEAPSAPASAGPRTRRRPPPRNPEAQPESELDWAVFAPSQSIPGPTHTTRDALTKEPPC